MPRLTRQPSADSTVSNTPPSPEGQYGAEAFPSDTSSLTRERSAMGSLVK